MGNKALKRSENTVRARAEGHNAKIMHLKTTFDELKVKTVMGTKRI